MKPMELEPEEVELVGKWVVVDGAMASDENDFRIEWLVTNSLKRLSTADGGWSSLYRDDRDGRFWEVIHPQGQMHGGGPRLMKLITKDEAAKKYSY